VTGNGRGEGHDSGGRERQTDGEERDKKEEEMTGLRGGDEMTVKSTK